MTRSSTFLATITFFAALAGSSISNAQSTVGDIVVVNRQTLLLVDDVSMSLTNIFDGSIGEVQLADINIRDGLVYGVAYNELYRFNTSTNTTTLVAELPEEPRALTLDQNGDFIGADRTNGVYRVDANSGAITTLYEDSFFRPSDVVVSANGDIYVAESTRSLSRLRNGVFTTIVDFATDHVTNVAIGNDGYLYTTDVSTAHIKRIHPTTGDSQIISTTDFTSHRELA
ncbi:MAG: hypothetical protein AAF497_16715, partial [Planctomycetota bacterium]